HHTPASVRCVSPRLVSFTREPSRRTCGRRGKLVGAVTDQQAIGEGRHDPPEHFETSHQQGSTPAAKLGERLNLRDGRADFGKEPTQDPAAAYAVRRELRLAGEEM